MTILQVPICQNDYSQNANPAKMTILQMSIGPMTILKMPIGLNDNSPYANPAKITILQKLIC